MDSMIRIEEATGDQVADHKIELVERKGIGHPDSLADAISEEISRSLSKAYMDTFGAIAHHNTDEVQIIGGSSSPAFGGGTVEEPIQVILAGRATREYEGKTVDVDSIAVDAARRVLDRRVRNLEVDKHVTIESRIGEGSADLTEMFFRSDEVPLANDTSFGIGHAPLTATEQLVLELEEYLNSPSFARVMPSVGEDIKLMAYRDQDEIQLTVGAAFISSEVEDIDEYVSLKEELEQNIKEKAATITDMEVEVHLNTADDVENGSVYITETGTSAEMGDDGSTGRGNRVSGLITPKRSMSLEASSGKNPVSHIGKIYNVLSHRMASEIVDENSSIEDVTVKLLSQIGKPITEPQVVDIRVNTEDGLDTSTKRRIKVTAEHWLHRPDEVMEDVLEGKIDTF